MPALPMHLWDVWEVFDAVKEERTGMREPMPTSDLVAALRIRVPDDRFDWYYSRVRALDLAWSEWHRGRSPQPVAQPAPKPGATGRPAIGV